MCVQALGQNRSMHAGYECICMNSKWRSPIHSNSRIIQVAVSRFLPCLYRYCTSLARQAQILNWIKTRPSIRTHGAHPHRPIIFWEWSGRKFKSETISKANVMLKNYHLRYTYVTCKSFHFPAQNKPTAKQSADRNIK